MTERWPDGTRWKDFVKPGGYHIEVERVAEAAEAKEKAEAKAAKAKAREEKKAARIATKEARAAERKQKKEEHQMHRNSLRNSQVGI